MQPVMTYCMSNKREPSKTLPQLKYHVYVHCIWGINAMQNIFKSVNIKLTIFKDGNNASLENWNMQMFTLLWY